jgi:predicted Zn-dependent protease
MLKTLLFAAAATLAQPSLARACENAIELTVDDYARMVVRAEKQLDAGQLGRAQKSIGYGKMPTAALQQRADDIRAVLKLRVSTNHKDLEAAAKHFRARSEAKPKDVRFRAWLGEALVALGQNDEARTVLAELHERDLVPDAHAYLALAKLSTGIDRYNFWKACRTRATNKELCELPDVAKGPRS